MTKRIVKLFNPRKWRDDSIMVHEILSATNKLLAGFVKPVRIKEKFLEIPKEVKQLGTRTQILGLGYTLIAMFFSFLLKLTNIAIEQRLIVLGILLFMLYRGQQVINRAYEMFSDIERNKYNLMMDNHVSLKGSMIIGKTSDKVLKYDKAMRAYKVLSNESVLRTVKQYLTNLWTYKVTRKFDIASLICVFVMLVVAVVTNTSIKQLYFVPLLVFFVLISIFVSAYIDIKRTTYNEEFKNNSNQQSIIINDLLRVPCVVKKDLDMRVSKFQKSLKNSRDNDLTFKKRHQKSFLFKGAITALFEYGIIIFYLVGVDWNTINLATITEITATLAIVDTALQYISRMVSTVDSTNERVKIIDQEEEDMSLILDVYSKETEKKSKIVKDIVIEPFSIRYVEESENDKPFELRSDSTIRINEGEIAILYGPSGSGKSTFMKMLTERIKLEKSVDIPSTDRFLFYDEKLRFGSLSIYEELFCSEEHPDLDKMKTILVNLHLWDEIQANCVDVWKWMSQKRFEQSLSNGQKQRLILAKMLYFMDKDIDVVVLDECTSGLDEQSDSESADAERILKYIVEYANSDKERIVIISTHQNIDGFKEKMANKFLFRNLYFLKGDGYNFVTEK